jgi:hypothetical protein
VLLYNRSLVDIFYLKCEALHCCFVACVVDREGRTPIARPRLRSRLTCSLYPFPSLFTNRILYRHGIARYEIRRDSRERESGSIAKAPEAAFELRQCELNRAVLRSVWGPSQRKRASATCLASGPPRTQRPGVWRRRGTQQVPFASSRNKEPTRACARSANVAVGTRALTYESQGGEFLSISGSSACSVSLYFIKFQSIQLPTIPVFFFSISNALPPHLLSIIKSTLLSPAQFTPFSISISHVAPTYQPKQSNKQAR